MLKVKILYGTEKGTAQCVANSIEKDLNSIFDCEIFNIKDYTQINFSEEQIVILVTSTYIGKPPFDAIKFLNWLNNNETKSFHNLKVAVLGIGHSERKKFCQAAKDFEEKLINYGATRLVTGPLGIEGLYGGPIGAADELYDFKEARPWMDHLEDSLKKFAVQYAAQKEVQNTIRQT